MLIGLGLLMQTGVHASEAEKTVPTVQLEIVRQMQGGGLDSRAYHSAQEEFAQLSGVLEQCAGEMNIDMDLDIRRFPGRFSSELPRITLYVHEWRSDRSTEVRAVIAARYRWNEEREDMGTFQGRESMPVTPIRNLRDQAFHNAMKKACEQFLRRLNELMEQGFFDTGKEGELRE